MNYVLLKGSLYHSIVGLGRYRGPVYLRIYLSETLNLLLIIQKILVQFLEGSQHQWSVVDCFFVQTSDSRSSRAIFVQVFFVWIAELSPRRVLKVLRLVWKCWEFSLLPSKSPIGVKISLLGVIKW